MTLGNGCAIEARYPGPAEPVTEEEYEEAVSLAEAIIGWAEEMIGARGIGSLP
ncbi:MAG: HEPN domain-containing protein [Anaerolineae bacterium]|jgi:HEPN domain-containing protein